MVIYKHQFLSVYFYFIVRYVVLLKPNHQNKDAHTHIKNYYNYLKHKILETYIITKSVKKMLVHYNHKLFLEIRCYQV